MTLIISHRGVGGRDNSLAAFERAIDIGCDMIEFDIRQSSDGHLLLLHDGKIKGDPVAQLSRNQISDRLGYEPAELHQLVDLSCGRIALNAEIKAEGYTALAMEQLAILDRDQLIVSSFHDRVIDEVKEISADSQTGLLSGASLHPSERFPRQRLAETKADYLISHFALAEIGALNQARKAEIPLIIWTVNSGNRLDHYINRELVYGVITDHPDKALAIRDHQIILNNH